MRGKSNLLEARRCVRRAMREVYEDAGAWAEAGDHLTRAEAELCMAIGALSRVNVARNKNAPMRLNTGR